VLDGVDIVMGTFLRSLASVGGFIAGERAVIDYLKHTVRPFVFSASLPAASVAAVATALHIMQNEPERRLRLLRIARLLRDELRSHGFSVLPGETAIVPVVIQDELDLCRLCQALLEEGIYINPCNVRPPLRTCCVSLAPRPIWKRR
jgi:7-keto-8-aminopelargonate synthetase-like enzyme